MGVAAACRRGVAAARGARARRRDASVPTAAGVDDIPPSTASRAAAEPAAERLSSPAATTAGGTAGSYSRSSHVGSHAVTRHA